jgi:hypothetical protein
MSEDSNYKKAYKLEEVNNAVRFDVPIGPDHPFFTNFSEVRGDFGDKRIYKSFNVDPRTFTYNAEINQSNKTLLFLAGMRGSGKTTELSKYAQKMHNKDCFFCVTCNLDNALDMNDLEYMDILIFQIERLFEEADKAQLTINENIIESLQNWFGERINEVNKSIKAEGGFEIEAKAESPSFFNFLKLTAKLKGSILGSKENATKIRTVFKNNFTDFAKKINEFIFTINNVLREKGLAKELLFIVDGLEKTATPDIRREVVIKEMDRIKQIKANTIFTLPIELMSETQRLMQMNEVVSFPFVKLREKKITPGQSEFCEKAIEVFKEFTYKRIDKSLFDSEATVRRAILYGGGSPREYLRVLHYAALHADENKGQIDAAALDAGVKKLAAITSNYITKEDLELLKELKAANDSGIPTPFGAHWQDLLEKLIVLEYNDGTYKRVNPVVEISEMYKYYVG